jgi:hypothetical protein
MSLWDWWKSLLLQGSPSAPSARRLDGRSKTLLAASIKVLPYETPGWITTRRRRSPFHPWTMTMRLAKCMRPAKAILPTLRGM